MDHRGRKRDSEDGIVAVVRNYFEELFKSKNPSLPDFDKASEGISRKVDDNMGRILDGVFVADEVKNALFDLGPTKALGPNGFHTVFFFLRNSGGLLERMCPDCA
ncbi:hypothetical protein ACOSQ2_019137 [Xanthoceras sorbifolium]